MTTNNYLAASIVSALCAAMVLATPALASEPDQDQFVVSADSAMSNWQTQTTTELNRALLQGGTRDGTPNDAIVQVTFTLDENGRAEDLKTVRGSGNWSTRMIAKRAIRSLDNLDQVPVSEPENVRFIANIIFASSERVHQRLIVKLDDMEKTRIASSAPARHYVALGN